MAEPEQTDYMEKMMRIFLMVEMAVIFFGVVREAIDLKFMEIIQVMTLLMISLMGRIK